MIRTMLIAMPVLVAALSSGCLTAGPRTSARAEPLPIAFNEQSAQELDYEALGKRGAQVTIRGMLRNSRKWEESAQEQWLLASAPDAPFSSYWLRLAKPVLELPPCFVEFWDPLGKDLVGPYRMTGTLGYHQLADVTFENLSIPESIPSRCMTAVRQQWREIGNFTIASGSLSTEDARRSSQLALSNFVRQQEPVLLSLSIDAKQALYCCAEGREYLSWHGEALARIYCLVDLESGKPVKLYIETDTYGLE